VRLIPRLYMTATPRIYSDASRTQVKEENVELCAMDDEKLYGREFYRLGFGECVSKGLLSDIIFRNYGPGCLVRRFFRDFQTK
jgi:predicted helicase